MTRSEIDDIIIMIEEGSNLTEEDFISYQKLWNQEYPIVIERITAIGARKTLLKNQKDRKYITARKNSVYPQKLVGLLIFQAELDPPWFTMVLDRNYQHQGIGSSLLDHSKILAHELHGWVIITNEYKKENGESYRSPLQFYLKNGFQKGKSRLIEEKKLELQEIIWTKMNEKNMRKSDSLESQI